MRADRGAVTQQVRQLGRNFWPLGKVQEINRQPGRRSGRQAYTRHCRQIGITQQEQVIPPDVINRRVPARIIVRQEVDQAKGPGTFM
jgi:hypothetical protein